MSIKNTKKFAAINAKITDLQKQKSQIEETFAQNMSQEITKMLIRKNCFNIDKNTLLKKIEALVDEHIR